MKSGMVTWYSFFFSGVNTATSFASSFGDKIALLGLKLTSFLYFSGTRHSYSRGIRESFFTKNFYLVDTPTKDGG